MIEFIVSDVNGHLQKIAGIGHGGIIAITAIVLAVVLAFYALRSIGLFMLAKKQNLKCAWIAFVPCAWFYLVCKLIGKVRFFHWSYQKIALLLCIIFSVAELLTLATNVLIFYPLVGNVLLGGKTVYIVNDVELFISGNSGYTNYPWVNEIIYDATFVWPYSAQTTINIDKALAIIQYFTMIFDLISTIIVVFVYINFFKKYWPQHFILASIFSFFGLFAPFAFIVRKKDPINYNDFLRQRYQAFYGPYGNPYGRPYGTRPPNAETPPEHPFSEFAERGEVDPGDPFAEFDNSDSKNESPFEEFDDKK